jgi:hypothetical protein
VRSRDLGQRPNKWIPPRPTIAYAADVWGYPCLVYDEAGGACDAGGTFQIIGKFVETSSYGQSQRNEVVDARDAAFARLLLWRDVNHNGISEPEELQSAAQAGVVAIQTDYKNKKRVDEYGNEFRQRGTIVWQDGNDHIFDIWLRWRD